jgi:uncharacterized SAM-binding protein YcdF (DUF218 family)
MARMLRRVLSIGLIAWVLGFVWFAMALPLPHDGDKTDGVIVLTGGEGRIDRGLYALRHHWARSMLVSGVDRDVKPNEFAVQYKVEAPLMQCCVTLGYESVDTRSNALEAARWITMGKLTSVRLVTTDWHMRRAAYEVAQTAPAGVSVIEDAVISHPTLRTLLREYHKLLARSFARVWGG